MNNFILVLRNFQSLLQTVLNMRYFGMDDGFMNEISTGKKIAGKIYFDVPEDKQYEIIYSPSFTLENKSITFEVVPQ